MSVPELQPTQPIDAEARQPVAVLCCPDRHVVLRGKIFGSPVIAVIIDDQEMIDAQRTVMVQKVRQPHHFVSHGPKDEDSIASQPRSVIFDRFDLPAFSPDPEQEPAPLPAQTICAPQPGQPFGADCLHLLAPVTVRLALLHTSLPEIRKAHRANLPAQARKPQSPAGTLP